MMYRALVLFNKKHYIDLYEVLLQGKPATY